MQPTSVFASTLSRLHADLVLVRLKRGGIGQSKMSAIFPERLQPNSTLCWIDGQTAVLSASGERRVAAGPVRTQVRLDTDAHFIRSLQRLGVETQSACALADRLERDEILICVQSANEAEIAIAWHTFQELEAEAITVGVSRVAETHSADATSTAGLSLEVAV